MIINPNIALDCMALIMIITIYISGRSYKNAKGIALLTALEVMMAGIIVTDILSWLFSDNYVNSVSVVFAYIFTSLLYMAQISAFFVVDIAIRKWLGHLSNPPAWWKALSLLPMIFMLALVIFNAFSGFVFVIDEEGFRHGPYHFVADVLIAVYFAYGFAVAFIEMVKSRDSQRVTDSFNVGLFLLLPIIAMVVQRFFDGIILTIPFSALAVMMVYVNMSIKLTNEIQDTVDKQNDELQEAKTAVMISQIQPHFLFNSLTAIMRLCDTNPKAAKNAIAEFAEYLRMNLESIKSSNLIPLETEIKHIDTYFSFEKMRFGDKLNFEKDIKVKNFVIPPLSIQPLVENAIKHGINKKAEGGTVKLTTYETDKDYCIEIKDDGVGFEVGAEYDKSRSHIGLENVTNRLEYMCKGRLEVESVVGKGTTVVVLIPKENSYENYCG